MRATKARAPCSLCSQEEEKLSIDAALWFLLGLLFTKSKHYVRFMIYLSSKFMFLFNVGCLKSGTSFPHYVPQNIIIWK